MELPTELPILKGTLTKTGSESPSNFIGAATGKTSLVFFTFGLTTSLKDAALAPLKDNDQSFDEI